MKRLKSASGLTACPDCDLLQQVPALEPGGTAKCARCGRRLAANRPGSLERTLALAATAAIVLVLSNLTPLMGLFAMGRTSSTTILGGAWQMWIEGQHVTAFLIAFCSVIAPGAYIGSMLAALLAIRHGQAPCWAGRILRFARINETWAMVEVMMLGILVALIKIADVATVVPGIAMYCVGALVLLIAAMAASFEPQEAWERIRWVDAPVPTESAEERN